MRILLISANRTSVNMPVFPLGPAILAGSLREEGHELHVLDLFEDRAPEATVAETIRTFRPQLIALSVRNIDNQDPFKPEFFLPEIRSVVRACRETSAAPIVIGGAGYSIFPHAALEYLEGDCGVVGEGERALCRIARAVDARSGVSTIPGVVTRGSRVLRRRGFVRKLDGIALPAREDLDIERYSGAGMMPIQGKRGCHRECIYCSSPLIEGRSVRLRSPASIVREIECAIERHGIESFFFVDNLFNYPEEHAVALCEAIVARGLRIQWRSILHPQYISRRLVERMKKAGCAEVSLGFESGSDRMLGALGKGFNTADVRRTSRLLREFEIGRMGFLLLGGPGEDRASVEESLAFVEANGFEAMKLAVGIRIYPGTALAKTAVRERVIPADATLLQPVFYLSDSVRDWLAERAREEAESHPGWRL